MPNKTNTNNNSEKKFNLEEELQNEILKNQQTEDSYQYNEVKYKKAKQKDISEENYYDRYENIANYGEIENPRVLIDALNLQEGVSYKAMNTSKFNSAVKKVIASSFRKKLVRYNADGDFVTNQEKKISVFPLDRLNRSSIIAFALQTRAQCFNYLCGDGKPERANPSFVKKLDNADSSKLVYNYEAIDKVVNNFESEDSLYKSTISNITFRHFKKVFDSMRFLTSQDDEEVYFIGSNLKEISIKETIKYVCQYRDLKEIHENRPWHYFITSYYRNENEKEYLRFMKLKMIQVAEHMGFEQELNDLLDSKGREFDTYKDILVDKMKEVYGIQKEIGSVNEIEAFEALTKEETTPVKETIEIVERVEETKTEEIKEESFRQNYPIDEKEVDDVNANTNVVEKIEVNPVSDVKDELHRYPVHGYGMSEKTVYVTEEEYLKETNPFIEEEEDNSLSK